ncbi:MAG TPA: beta-N-acetylhexosaminidase, partial [Armatimonadota bacterium]
MIRMIVFALFVLGLPMTRAENLDLSAGHVRAVFSQGRHLRLFYNGIPVTRESHLYVVKPGWTGPILNQDQEIPKFTTATEGDAKVGTVAYETDGAWAKYRVEVRPDDTVKIAVTWGSKGAPAEVEYTNGYINANLISGVPFKAETIDGPKSGTVPMYATTDDQNASQLCPLVKQITFESRIGRIEIAVEGTDKDTAAMKLFDARGGQQDWARANPVFWFGIGVPQIPVKPGQQGVTVTWKFSNPVANKSVEGMATGAKVKDIDTARVPYRAELPVIPHPKEMKVGEGKARLDKFSRIYVMKSASPEAKQGAKELQAELEDVWGLSLPIGDLNGPIDELRNSVDIYVWPVGDKYEASLTPPSNPEAYRLLSGEYGVSVVGSDPRGVYYGIQTLKQLIRVDQDGVYIKAVKIRDWPSMPFRGVHWFGGPQSVPFHEAMISKICAATKLNQMLYQVDFSQWKSQPKIWDKGRSTPLADMKKTVDYARAHFMEPIPLVNGLGHADWMFVNGQNLDVATDPVKRYQYDPTKGRVYTDILFPVMQEAIDIFKPKTFHIGRDEITTGGLFPPKGVSKPVNDLILEDVNKVHDWLKAKGIATMMWGDEFLHWPDEANDAGNAPDVPTAKARRSGLPKDIIIADWHYDAQKPDFPSVGIWQKEGFQVVGCPWYERGNIQNFARVLGNEKAMGLCQTTWAGYSMSTDLVGGASFIQFVAYLLAGEYAWNGGQPGLDALGYDPDEAFRTFWDRKPVDMSTHKGFTVELPVPSSEFRVPSPIPELGASHSKLETLAGTTFSVGPALWMAGALNPAGEWPKSIDIPLGDRKAGELRFLWATTNVTEADTVVARVKVTYTDGTTVEKLIAYGGAIFAFEDLR